MRLSSVLICAWFLGSSAARVRVEDKMEESIQNEATDDAANSELEPTWRDSEAWFCDCGRMKDFSGEGQMTYNQLTQEVSRKKTNTSKVDYFVNWRTTTRRDEFFAMPEKYWHRAKILTYKTQGACMSACLKACNSQEHPAARFQHKMKGFAARVSKSIHKQHSFARCIPKKDWTCLSNVLVPGGNAYRFYEAYGLKVQSVQFHAPADLSVVTLTENPKIEDVRATYLYTQEVFDNSGDCWSSCAKYAVNGPSWECHFYPSRHFHDMTAAFRRKYTSTGVRVKSKEVTNKGTGVPQWGCCNTPYYPGKCDWGRACSLESWVVPEDYFVGDCAPEHKPDGEPDKFCKDWSAAAVQMLSSEGCPDKFQTANGRTTRIQTMWPVDHVTSC